MLASAPSVPRSFAQARSRRGCGHATGPCTRRCLLPWLSELEGTTLELHYYHLWDRDCGPLSPHALDVEHVSALLVRIPGQGSSDWVARYWYAAAHEDTVCDTSNAARAGTIHAVENGPSVWVSAGKHASFLAQELCGQRGCGVDRCEDVVPLPRGSLVNLGERGRPLHGAEWIASSEWPLGEKLELNFTPELVAAVEASEETVLARVNGHGRPAQLSLSLGGDALGALGEGGRHGAGSVATAGEESRGALGTTFRGVGGALLRFGRALGLAEDRER